MVEIVAGAVQAVVNPLMEKLVIPKIQKLAQNVVLDYKLNLVPIENHFREYLERTYIKLSVANTIALKNRQKELKKIYEPLTISTTEKNRDRTKITSYPKQLIRKYHNILVTDTAGMGKSTLMKRIFLDVIDNLEGIPLFIELRRLSQRKTILQEIQEQLNAINKEFDKQLLVELLANGGFIIILDGFDEIALDERSYVSKDIQSFIDKTHQNIFFMTSRPEGALASFNSFQGFSIHSLSKKEAYDLLKRYDEDGTTSRSLIGKLKQKDFSSINDFLTNPFLTSLLFTAFEHKQTIPLKKHLFYRQVFDAYFESHDLSKGDSFIRDKSCALGIDEFECVLRYLAFISFKNNQQIEYTKDELLAFLSNIKKCNLGFTFEPSKVINDLVTSVPLFNKDGIYYKWSHKSIYEYFTAQFIYKDSGEKRDKMLIQLYESINLNKYINILDLYCDIDYKSFSRTIEYEFLKEYERFVYGSYSDEYFNELKKDVVEQRKDLCTFCHYALFEDDSHDTMIEKGTEDVIRFFNETFKNCSSRIDISEYRWSFLIEPIKYFKNRSVFLLKLDSWKRSIGGILLNKKVDYMEKYGSRKGMEDSKDDFSLDDLKLPVLIDDDPKSEMNSLFYFARTNNIINQYKGFREINFFIVKAEAIKALKRIEEDILAENVFNGLI